MLLTSRSSHPTNTTLGPPTEELVKTRWRHCGDTGTLTRPISHVCDRITVNHHDCPVRAKPRDITRSSEHAHPFFATDHENDTVKLRGTDVVRSETTIYVLVIVASLGAMIAMHRGRRAQSDTTSCVHGDGPASHSITGDRPPSETPVDELRPLERHHEGPRAAGRHRDR